MEFAIDAIFLPKLAKLLRDCPDIKVEIVRGIRPPTEWWLKQAL
jgi:hypothetical protein